MEFLTQDNILFLISVGAVVFAIYSYFRTPQESMEKKQSLDALAAEKDKLIAEKDLGTKATILAQKELETKALLLAEQVKNKEVENERRFNEMTLRLDAGLALAQNHIHTVDTKVDKLIDTIVSMGNKITELTTIIGERIPSKN
jgi:ribosome assembly protein YihI (activator of Der GTPase)